MFPNITGEQIFRRVVLGVNEMGAVLTKASGAFSNADHSTKSSTIPTGGSLTGSTRCVFSAKLNNNIFGLSSTVQVSALRGLALIRAY